MFSVKKFGCMEFTGTEATVSIACSNSSLFVGLVLFQTTGNKGKYNYHIWTSYVRNFKLVGWHVGVEVWKKF